MTKRVVITGMGVISPAGCNKHELWTNVVGAVPCISKLTFEPYQKIPSQVAAVINQEKFTSLVESNKIADNKLRTISRATCFAILAARQAVIEARLQDSSACLKEKIGVAIGSGMSDFSDIYESKNNLDQSYNRVSPYFLPRILLNMAAGNVSMEYGFKGPNHCISTACATGAHAIGDSFKIIQRGAATAMVCGGTEACLNPLTVAGFCRLRALSSNFNDNPHEASRPFDEQRDGFVIGEGAAILVLEEMEHALTRNANIYAEILGYGMSGDAYTLTTPSRDGQGAVLAMKRALGDAKLLTQDVTYINAHATSTPIGDATELSAIGNVWHNSKGKVHVSSTKGCHGHLLGAAGSLETVCTVLACYHSIIPPTCNLEKCCPHRDNIECNIEKKDWVGVHKRIALKNSFGFGGTNATLCITEFQK